MSAVAQLGRVLDSRSRGYVFESQRRHYIVFLSKTRFPLLFTVQPWKTSPYISGKNADWDVKKQHSLSVCRFDLPANRLLYAATISFLNITITSTFS